MTCLITGILDRHIKEGEAVEAYLCGSPGMINIGVAVLKKKGVTEDRVYYGKFS